MSKSLTIWALIAPLAVAGCMTEGQFLASRQPTAIEVGREPRAIRNELSRRNRRGAFTRAHAAAYPGTPNTGRITRAIYDRRCGLRPTASLSGFLSDGWRQLHGVRRSDLVSLND